MLDLKLFAEALQTHADAMRRGEIPMGQELTFDPLSYDMQTAPEKLLAGWYRAVITKAVLSKADYGLRLDLDYKIIDGPNKDRVVKRNYSIAHTNPDTQRIANSQLATICGCIGLWTKMQNTDQLCNIPLQIKVTEPKDNDYNDVKGWKTIDGNDPVKPGTGAAMNVAQIGGPPAIGGAPVAQLAAPGAPPPLTAPAAPPLAPPVQHNPINAAIADGWAAHPASAEHMWKGAEVKTTVEVAAMYPAPAPTPVYAPPATYAPPQQPGAPPATAAAPTWTPNQPGSVQPPVWNPNAA